MTPGRWLALIVLLALGLRIIAILTRQMVQFDETAYLRMAENLAAGHKPYEMMGANAVHFSPLFPALIAAFHFVLRDFVVSGYAVVAVFGSLLAVPFFLLGRDLLSERSGLLAAALIAVMPFFISTSEYIYSEQPYIFFLLMGLFFAWHMLNHWRRRCAAGAGLLLGIAYLTNPAGLFYILAVGALLLTVAWRRRLWRRLPAVGGAFMLLFAVPAAPYLIFIHAEMGNWTFTGKGTEGLTYAAQLNLNRDSPQQNEQVMSAIEPNGEVLIVNLGSKGANPISLFILQPVTSMKTLAKQIYYLHKNVLSQVTPLFLLVLAGAGLFARGWDRQRAAAIGFLAVMTLPVLVVLATLAFARAMMPYIPVLVLLAGEGWRRAEDWATGSAEHDLTGAARACWRRLAPWLVGAAVLAPMLYLTVQGVQGQAYPVQYREAGEWLKQEYGAGTRIMTRDAAAAYYAGGTMVILPYASLEGITGYADRHQSQFLVISRADIANFRPGLAPLLGGEPQAAGAATGRWQLAGEIRPDTDHDILIFRLASPGAPS